MCLCARMLSENAIDQDRSQEDAGRSRRVIDERQRRTLSASAAEHVFDLHEKQEEREAAGR